jgi:hypothetical protein
MKINTILNNCWHRLLPVLAALLAQSVFGQGIIYVQMPPTIRSTNGAPSGTTPVTFPEDALGTYVGDPLSITINGQTICTFYSGNSGNSGFTVTASSTSAIIGQQPFENFPDDIWVVPLSAGQGIGSDAASFSWFDNGLLASSIGGGIIGEPPLSGGYFAGVESAYMGFDFQQGGQTYYGWISLGSPYVFGTGGQGWIYSYAYETEPDTPIAAGAVPEPSTLALLSLGGLAILALRQTK